MPTPGGGQWHPCAHPGPHLSPLSRGSPPGSRSPAGRVPEAAAGAGARQLHPGAGVQEPLVPLPSFLQGD